MALCGAILFTSEMPLYDKPPSIAVAFTRLMAGMFMQIKMSKELKEGLDKMKYAINHSWKFENERLAYLAGFFQSTTIIVVTILNYYTIIAATEVIDIVMNFLALAVIAELDDFFFEAHGT